MSDISFFGRLGNLWKGFLSLMLTDVEKEHPEIVYQNSIDSMISKYAQLKNATSSIIRRRQDVEARMSNAKAELVAVTRDLEAALSTDQDDLGIVLIEKKNALEAAIVDLTQEQDVAIKDADEAKGSLMQVKSEIEKLKAERDRALAQVKSAEARIKIQEQLDGLSVEADVKALDGVRDHIKNTVAKANLGEELQNSDLDKRLAGLRKTASVSSAKAQLDAMKKSRAAQTTEGKSL